MNEKKIRERLAGTREWIFDPDRVRNRALLEQLRRERELRGLERFPAELNRGFPIVRE